jgi:hypothetical protein
MAGRWPANKKSDEEMTTRYRELADATQALTDSYTAALPTSGLPSLLQLAERTRKHSTRLDATAHATAGGDGAQPDDQRQVDRDRSGNDAYGVLPDNLAVVTRQAPQASITNRNSRPQGKRP